MDAAVGAKYGTNVVANSVISGNTISGVVRGISGNGLISNNIITDVSQYGIMITRDGAQVTNNVIKRAGSRCIYIHSANDTVASGNFMQDCGRH